VRRDALQTVTLGDLDVEDEASFRHVGIYRDLKDALLRDRYRFVVLPPGPSATWDRALFLNLTYFEGEGDVLVDRYVAADVVAHAAWHHLAGKTFEGRRSADALLFGEAIASAFDLYLVGRLLGHAPDSSFLETQVPRMAEVAGEAGIGPEGFESLLGDVAARPEAAFEELRQLLFDVSSALVRVSSVLDAARVLDDVQSRRLSPLLHHYELSNWVLFARSADLARDERVLDVDARMRAAPDSVAWLQDNWL
jgi:hypothetical protein